MQSNDRLEELNKHLEADAKQRSSVPQPSHDTAGEPETGQAESKKVTLKLGLFFVTFSESHSVFVCCSGSVKRLKVASLQQRQRPCNTYRWKQPFALGIDVKPDIHLVAALYSSAA